MSVLTLQQAKDHLNITQSVNDAELQTIIDAAEATIANRIGPLSVTSVASVVDGRTDMLFLPTTPVISVTSVTPISGTAVDVTGLTVDPSGLVTFNGWGWFVSHKYTVVYSAGYATVPADLLMGIKEMTRHLWMFTQRSAAKRPGSGSSSDERLPGYLIPYAVAEFIAPFTQVGV